MHKTSFYAGRSFSSACEPALRKTNCIGQNEGRPINKFHFWKFPKSPCARHARTRIIICRSTDPFVTFGFRKRAFDDESERGLKSCVCGCLAAPTGQRSRSLFLYSQRINKTAAFNITPARSTPNKREGNRHKFANCVFQLCAAHRRRKKEHGTLFSLRAAAGLLNFKISLFHSNTHIHSEQSAHKRAALLFIMHSASCWSGARFNKKFCATKGLK